MQARVVVFRVVAGGRTILETDSLSNALARCRRARDEGVGAHIDQFRPTSWPPQNRAVVRA